MAETPGRKWAVQPPQYRVEPEQQGFERQVRVLSAPGLHFRRRGLDGLGRGVGVDVAAVGALACGGAGCAIRGSRGTNAVTTSVTSSATIIQCTRRTGQSQTRAITTSVALSAIVSSILKRTRFPSKKVVSLGTAR